MLFGKSKREKKLLQKEVLLLKDRLSLATTYLERIAEGNLDASFDFSDESSSDDDGKAFYHTLLRVQNKLTEYAKKEAERKWVADGMAKFMSLIGGNNRDTENFYDILLRFMVQYTGANQAGLFLLNDQNTTDPFLEMVACYAFGKKKYEQKRIDIGQGMLGQCFQEKKMNFFTEVPQYYTKITSGLGEATPSFLLLIPIKYNEDVLGVIELAYFKRPKAYQIEFTEKIAESIASVTINLRHAKLAEKLFEESKEKAEMLQAQEETLRQHVEEMVATQEEMKRHQEELNRQTALMKFIIDNVPFPIFVKDEKSRYTLVNIAESKLFNLNDKDLLGRDDSALVSNEEEWKVIRRSDEQVLSTDKPVELPLQHFTTVSGKSFIFKTTKIPFVNQVTGKKNILGVSVDLTEKLTLEKKLLNEKRINTNNVFLNISGRQRMLSQKIGFYCETLMRGKKQNAALLRNAIELHEHTMQVIRFGGMPMDIACETPLRPLVSDLIPYMTRIERVWKIYKQAAEDILYFSSVDLHLQNDNGEAEKNITIIEDNGELLLSLNNDFMLAYIEVSQAQVAEAY